LQANREQIVGAEAKRPAQPKDLLSSHLTNGRAVGMLVANFRTIMADTRLSLPVLIWQSEVRSNAEAGSCQGGWRDQMEEKGRE
jgi:hypothetical protein